MKLRRRNSELTTLNILPLIDVVFLLLIFFMLTSSMIKIRSVNIQLPGSSSSQSVEKSPIVVAVDENKNYFLNDQSIQEQDLKIELSSMFLESPEEPVILSVAKDLDAQALISTMDLIRESGGQDISIATKQK